jgi:SAM-dependent methyltransferase
MGDMGKGIPPDLAFREEAMPASVPQESVYRFRAIPSRHTVLENDPEPMVQQQLARLYFFAENVGVQGARVLDWGCGAGYNCHWLHETGTAQEVVGFDLSGDAVALARQAFPGIDFRVADACAPDLDLEPGRWDRILSCEVLEHVPDQPAFLANLRRHLAGDGVAFVTTPNRPVFSLGFEPSPVNKEHIKELDHDELVALLRPHFSSVEIYGQRFRDPGLLRAWKQDVEEKIRQCRQGTRWQEKPPLRTRLRSIKVVDWVYQQVGPLRSAWRALRWGVGGRVGTLVDRWRAPYRWDDFEVCSENLSDALWLCAVVRP